MQAHVTAHCSAVLPRQRKRSSHIKQVNSDQCSLPHLGGIWVVAISRILSCSLVWAELLHSEKSWEDKLFRRGQSVLTRNLRNAFLIKTWRFYFHHGPSLREGSSESSFIYMARLGMEIGPNFLQWTLHACSASTSKSFTAWKFLPRKNNKRNIHQMQK